MIDDVARRRDVGSAFISDEDAMTVGLNLTQIRERLSHVEILRTKRQALEDSIAAANETIAGIRAHLRHVLGEYNSAVDDAQWFTQNMADEFSADADRLEDQEHQAGDLAALHNFIGTWRTWDGARISETDLRLPGNLAELDLGHSEALAELPTAIDP